MKPALFIASSRESKTLAEAVQRNLENVADVTCWHQDFYAPGTITLDVLMERAVEFEFGVFVFSANDLVRLREHEYAAVRDNVLFEFGIFISRLGRKRVLMLVPDNTASPLHLPSDLAGLTGATYDAGRVERDADNLTAALGGACSALANVIRAEWNGPLGLTGDLVMLLRYLSQHAGSWMTAEQFAGVIGIFNGAPDYTDKQLGRAWRRATKYMFLWLHIQGLVNKNDSTSVIYQISKKGRRLVEWLQTQPTYASIFKEPLRRLTDTNWGQGAVPQEPNQQARLSGNDYRLLFAVYERPGTFMSTYADAMKEPAKEPLLERARRLELMGFLTVLADSNELDITAAGRDIVGPIKAVADQVYGRD